MAGLTGHLWLSSIPLILSTLNNRRFPRGGETPVVYLTGAQAVTRQGFQYLRDTKSPLSCHGGAPKGSECSVLHTSVAQKGIKRVTEVFSYVNQSDLGNCNRSFTPLRSVQDDRC